ncbi:Hypothetical predicted protein, partial [Marmota monax]
MIQQSQGLPGSMGFHLFLAIVVWCPGMCSCDLNVNCWLGTGDPTVFRRTPAKASKRGPDPRASLTKMASGPDPPGSHLGEGGGSGGRGTTLAGAPASKVTMRKSPGKGERSLAASRALLGPGAPGALRAARVTAHSTYGEAASAPALPTAAGTLGG